MANWLARAHATLSDKPAECLLRLTRPEAPLHRAVITDTDSIPDTVIVTVAVRGVAVGWILVPKDRFDGLAVLAMLERHNQTIH